MFDRLSQATLAQRGRVQSSMAGLAPEEVLVLETVGSVANFSQAVRALPGMEWLGEFDEEFEPDEDFPGAGRDRSASVAGRLFLVMSDQGALSQLLSLWNRYRLNGAAAFGHGLAPWRHAFEQLRGIRFWSAEDRFRDTGQLELWGEELARGQQMGYTEIELWFRESSDARISAAERVAGLVDAAGGATVQKAEISEVRYQAILAELPRAAIERIVETRDMDLAQGRDIWAFRPTGQSVRSPSSARTIRRTIPAAPLPSGAPIVALLDGLPLERHRALDQRLLVDDPDGFASNYLVRDHKHGTAMASLICRGDLERTEEPINSRVYVRPIMQPDSRTMERSESPPPDRLFVDLVHRAVRRMYEGESGQEPTAPDVKVINLSICNPWYPFDRVVSATARMLDWLSAKYGVLFVVSAGNQLADLDLGIPRTNLGGISSAELQDLTLKAVAASTSSRRILSPAESINALTVGAVHTDATNGAILGHRLDPFDAPGLPSPISPLGFGFRRSVKPDVLAPGGRAVYAEQFVGASATLTLVPSPLAPGQQVAAPPDTPGILDATIYSIGTSNAAALTTRLAAQLYEVLKDIRREEGDEQLPIEYDAVLLKAMLVHTAFWPDSKQHIAQMYPGLRADAVRKYLTRFYGYGVLDGERVVECTEQRVTLLACGSVRPDTSHIYEVPLPPSLSGPKVWRRITATLAWFSPISAANQKYRCAALALRPTVEELRVSRTHADWTTVR